MMAFLNTETFVWNIFGYDQLFECYRSVTLYVLHPVYKIFFLKNLKGKANVSATNGGPLQCRKFKGLFKVSLKY